ncbi:hypothetical protein Droror1_Dr00000784 [Drosera rotundifolia]
METKFFIYGKVHLVLGEGNLAVNVKLHSLKIKDELQGHLAAEPQYLAYSVVKNEQFIASPTALEAHVKDVSSIFMEEEDIFNDALPEFLPGPDSMERFWGKKQDSGGESYVPERLERLPLFMISLACFCS